MRNGVTADHVEIVADVGREAAREVDAILFTSSSKIRQPPGFVMRTSSASARAWSRRGWALQEPDRSVGQEALGIE
jgi:hypothetical protein